MSPQHTAAEGERIKARAAGPGTRPAARRGEQGHFPLGLGTDIWLRLFKSLHLRFYIIW